LSKTNIFVRRTNFNNELILSVFSRPN
jgi:hypothetical protein